MRANGRCSTHSLQFFLYSAVAVQAVTSFHDARVKELGIGSGTPSMYDTQAEMQPHVELIVCTYCR